MDTDSPVIVAHRGGKCSYPENTLEAFQQLIENGFQAVEMDIRYDYFKKRFFLEHDFFHHPKKRKNLLLNIIPNLPPELFLVIEFKTLSCFNTVFVKKFQRVYKEALLGKRKLLIQSFNPFVLMHLKRLAPEIPRGFLCRSNLWYFLFQNFFYRFIQPEILLLEKKLLTRKRIETARNQRMKIFTFVLNREKYWIKAFRMNLDGIITDYPLQLREFLTRHRE